MSHEVEYLAFTYLFLDCPATNVNVSLDRSCGGMSTKTSISQKASYVVILVTYEL